MTHHKAQPWTIPQQSIKNHFRTTTVEPLRNLISFIISQYSQVNRSPQKYIPQYIFFATFKIFPSSVDNKFEMFQFVHFVAVTVLMAVATRNKYSLKVVRKIKVWLFRSSEIKQLK